MSVDLLVRSLQSFRLYYNFFRREMRECENREPSLFPVGPLLLRGFCANLSIFHVEISTLLRSARV